MQARHTTILSTCPTKNHAVSSDPFDEAVLSLAVQAAFLQGFAENLSEEELPIEMVAPLRKKEEDDYGWRAGLRW